MKRTLSLSFSLLAALCATPVACGTDGDSGAGGLKNDVGGGSGTSLTTSGGPGSGGGTSSGTSGTTTGGTGTTTTGTATSGAGGTASTGTTSTGTASSSTTTASSSSATTGAGGAAQSGSGIFEAPEFWTTPIDASPKSAASDAIIGWLDQNGGWGTGVMKIDFSIEVLAGDASTPFQSFQPTSDFYSPDCDDIPYPVPSGGALEGEQGYACTNDGDCHLIVVDSSTKTLYEMWRANIVGNFFEGGCAVTWDLTKTYPDNLRGEGCTSADAGGFPIAAMLFSADEVAAGEIAHAIRFILPNSRIRDNVYVHPGTHSTGPTSGGPNAPPYGVRFRLRSDFPLASLPSDGARVVAQAMQKYGMFLADAGQIALTAQADTFTQHKWSDANVDVDSQSLTAIQVTDMEVVEMGAPIDWSGDCIRNP